MKQAILIRQDLKLPKGKACVQSAHASVEATLKADPDIVTKWRSTGMAKIVLKVADQKELIKFFQQAKDNNIAASLITDAGKTVIAPGTKTAVAIGPAEDEEIDELVSELKLF